MCPSRTSGGPAAPPVTWGTRVTNVTSVPSGRALPRPAAMQAAWRLRCGCTSIQPSAWLLPSDCESEVCKFLSSYSDCRAATQARTLTSHKIRFDAIAKHKKNYLCGQVPIKTFGTIFFWRVESFVAVFFGIVRKKCLSCYLPSRKIGHFMLSSVPGCRILIDFLLLWYFCQSITWNLLGVALCSHQQIENSIQLYHFNNKLEI